MVLNKLSLSEHMRKESMRNVMMGTTKHSINNPHGNGNDDGDDHTETTFSIDDSFLGIHDDSLKSRHDHSISAKHNGGLSTLSEENDGGGFEKVPMRWLPTTPSMPSKTSFRRRRYEDYEEEEEEEEELDMRDLMKESRAMSDCSFKPHESLDSLGWEDMRKYMRKTGSRVMSEGSFKSHQRRHQPQQQQHQQQHYHESMRSEDGWGSMRDLSIHEGTTKRFSCSTQSTTSMNDSSFFEYLGDSLAVGLNDSTFARNMEYLQQQAKDITSSVGPTGIFVRNMETISMMFMGGGRRTL